MTYLFLGEKPSVGAEVFSQEHTSYCKLKKKIKKIYGQGNYS